MRAEVSLSNITELLAPVRYIINRLKVYFAYLLLLLFFFYSSNTSYHGKVMFLIAEMAKI